MNLFAERLKEIRRRKNITLDELAEKIGYTKSTLSRYENEKRVPNIEFINQVADFFNVSTDYLLGRTDSPEVTILEKDKLPLELQGKVDAIHIVEAAIEKGLSKETIAAILDLVERIKKDPT